LAEIARLLGGELRGSDAGVRGVAALDEAQPDELSLCGDRRQRAALRATRAGGVLLAGRLVELVPEAPCPCVLVADPRRALAIVLAELHPATEPAPGVQAGALVAAEAAVDPTARVETGAQVGPGARVGPGCWIGPGAVVAAGTRPRPPRCTTCATLAHARQRCRSRAHSTTAPCRWSCRASRATT